MTKASSYSVFTDQAAAQWCRQCYFYQKRDLRSKPALKLSLVIRRQAKISIIKLFSIFFLQLPFLARFYFGQLLRKN